MDLTCTDGTGLPPELVSLQEKALDFDIEQGRADIDLRRKVTYFLMGVIGSAFIFLLVMLVLTFLGAASPPLPVIGGFMAATVTGAGYMLSKVVSSLSGKGRADASDSLVTLGRSALSNVRRALGSPK
jgi:hypothetical protein